MRWEDETYVRLYVRDTPDWKLLGWEARALLVLLLRKVDRAGVLDIGRHGSRGLAAVVEMPFDVVDRALPELLEDKCVIARGRYIVIPNFLEAQSVRTSNRSRVQLYRERQRARDRLVAILGEPDEPDLPDLSRGVTPGNDARNPDRNEADNEADNKAGNEAVHTTLRYTTQRFPLKGGEDSAPAGAAPGTQEEAVASPEAGETEAGAHREGPEPEADSAADGAFPWPPLDDPAIPHGQPGRTRRGEPMPEPDSAPPDRPLGHRGFIDAFDALFRDHHGGAKPTWGKVEGGMVKTLLKKHSAEEALRRAVVMFDMAPRFPAEHPDLKTLVGHFDKFAGTDEPKVGALKIDKQPEYSGGDVKM